MAESVSIKLEINKNAIRRILNNRSVGVLVAETCAKYMMPYVPMQSGTLSQSYNTEPWKVEYTQPYAHYQYIGQAYGPSFPLFQNGAVVGFWSKPGEKKHPTGKSLNYRKEQHPLATSKWDEAMVNAKGNQVAKEISEYIKRGI